MCNRFVIPDTEELASLARAIEYGEAYAPSDAGAMRRAEPRIEAYPGREVPVLITSSDMLRPLRIKYLSWGYPLEGKKHAVFNTRVETAGRLPTWRESFEHRHCVIAACSFVEASQNETETSERTGKPVKRLYAFRDYAGGPVLIAGIWKPGSFSMLTQDASGAVEGVRDRMPIVLDMAGARDWLYEGRLEPSHGTLVAEPV